MHTAKFPKGVPMDIEDVAAVVGDAFIEMNENPPESVLKVREEMMGKSGRERMTWNQREAAVVPDGLYGYPKAIQRTAEAASRKLTRQAVRIAKRIFSKDEQVVDFLKTHAKREGSKSAKVLLAAMGEIGPKLASQTTKKTAATEYGLYGFKARTADLGLDACKEIRTTAGRITASVHQRKAALHDKIAGFFRENAKQCKCAYSGMLFSCYPDASVKFASSTKKMKLASVSMPINHKGQSPVVARVGTSGDVFAFEVLPSDFEGLKVLAQKQAPAESLSYHATLAPNILVAAQTHLDNRTHDVDCAFDLYASVNGKIVVTAKVAGTAIYQASLSPVVRKEGNVTYLASGDSIEWLD